MWKVRLVCVLRCVDLTLRGLYNLALSHVRSLCVCVCACGRWGGDVERDKKRRCEKEEGEEIQFERRKSRDIKRNSEWDERDTETERTIEMERERK